MAPEDKTGNLALLPKIALPLVMAAAVLEGYELVKRVLNLGGERIEIISWISGASWIYALLGTAALVAAYYYQGPGEDRVSELKQVAAKIAMPLIALSAITQAASLVVDIKLLVVDQGFSATGLIIESLFRYAILTMLALVTKAFLEKSE